MFEWDAKKAAINLQRHGVSFEEAQTVFDDPFFLVFPDPMHSSGEARFIVLGESSEWRALWWLYTRKEAMKFALSVRVKPTNKNKEIMKKKNTNEMEDDVLPHYDFAKLPIIKRGPGYSAKAKMVRIHRVTLEPDVAKVFPDDASVNQALRLLIQAREIGVKKTSRR